MGLPRGLTDITVHLQTPAEREESRRLADARDWARMDDLKPAVILHFGAQQVRFSTSTRSIMLASRHIVEIQKEIQAGRIKVETPKFDERPTAWMQLGSLPFDD